MLININGLNQETVRLIIRFTAKLSVALFAFAFSASSLNFVLNSSITKRLVVFRPNIGLAFGTSHIIHLLSLLYLQLQFHPVFRLADLTSLIAGGIAYVFIIVLMITTFPKAKKIFSKWKLLHTIGSYWIWVIFFNSYLMNVIDKGRYHGFLLLLIVVFLLRVYKLLRK